MRKRTHQRRLGIQSLEKRNLLAAHISELLVDPLFGDNDTDQMVEIRGEPETQLDDGTYLLVISERGLDEGKIHGIFDLSGQQFGTSGYLVLLQKDSPHVPAAGANVLQSTEEAFSSLPGDIYSDTHPLSERIDFIIGANAYMLVQSDVAPALGSDVDADNDGVIDPAFADDWNVLDSVSLHPFVGRGDIAYGDIVFAETGSVESVINARDGVEVVFTRGFGYAGRVGESIGSLPKDWVMGTVQDETRRDDAEPPRWALVDNLFGVPTQYPFSGRDLDHVGEPNFVGGVRGTLSTASPQIDVTGVTVLADTNGNGTRDVLTFVVDPDDVVDTVNPLDADGNPKTYPLLNAYPGVTITNFALDTFPASKVTAEKESDFPNTLENRIFATGGIDWFDTNDVLRFDFYRPVNAVSIVAIGTDNPLSYAYGRIDAFNAAGELVDTDRSSLLIDSARETISVSSTSDDIAYVFAYSDDIYLDGGPFGRFDRMVYSQLEPAAVTDENGFYEIENLFPGDYMVSPVGSALAGPPREISIAKYENFDFDFSVNPNRPPTVENAIYQLNENSGIGSVVGTLQASDPDGQVLSYRFAESGSHGFEIDSQLGVISVGPEATLDFEANPQYQFDVVVSDSVNAESVAAVTVDLRDLNEAPSVSPATFSVSELATLNSVIGSVTASDPDTALEQSLSYEIIGGSGSQAFQIDEITGVIRVSDPASLDHESVPELSLDVRVSDGGDPNLQAVATITVLVEDANEPPELAGSTFQIDESFAPGAIVGVVSASDPDDGQVLRYSIAGGSGADRFTINPISGQLQVAEGADLDYESETEWTLLVSARDNGTPVLSTTVEQIIEVGNVDEGPAFVASLEPSGAESGAMYDWTVPLDAAVDPEGDDFTYDATANGGDLPSWLVFDSATRNFSGIPSSFYAGAFEIVLHAIPIDSPTLKTSLSVTIDIDTGETPLHNKVVPQDVNSDGELTALDALRIINYMGRAEFNGQVDSTFRFTDFLDVTGDNSITSLDALRVINELARRDLPDSNGESWQHPLADPLESQARHDLALDEILAESRLF